MTIHPAGSMNKLNLDSVLLRGLCVQTEKILEKVLSCCVSMFMVHYAL